MGGSKGGGGGGTSTPMYVPPVTPAPEYRFEDTAGLEEEANKKKRQVMAMKGRQSTILTGGDWKQNAVLGKRQLLGA